MDIRHTDSPILHCINSDSVYRRFKWTSKSLFLMSCAINKSDVLWRTFVLRASMWRLLRVGIDFRKKKKKQIIVIHMLLFINLSCWRMSPINFELIIIIWSVVHACDVRQSDYTATMLSVTFSHQTTQHPRGRCRRTNCQRPATSISVLSVSL